MPLPLLLIATGPAGVIAVSGEVSVTVTGQSVFPVTVAVHWVGWLTATEEGLQLMLVEVVLGDVDAKNTPLLQVPLGTPLPLFPPIQYTYPESNAQLCV